MSPDRTWPTPPAAQNRRTCHGGDRRNRRDLGGQPACLWRRGTPVPRWHGPCRRFRWPAAKDLSPGSAAIGPPERSVETGDRPAAARRDVEACLSMRASISYAPPFAPTAGGPAATRPFPSWAADMCRRGSKPSSAWLRPAAEVAKCCHVAGGSGLLPERSPIRAIMVMARSTPARWSSGQSRDLAAAHYIQLRLVRRRTPGPLGSHREGQG